MATAREKLEYKISLIDKLSGPSKKLMKSYDKMTALAKRSAWDFAKGGAGIAALGYGLTKATAPAREFDKAMNTVRSLDVNEKEMLKLGRAAKKMAFQYGMSASEFVRSSYDIQSSIAGLDNGELAKFTTAGNILAKGTLADAGTITDYMGTMYSVFKNQAKEMGKGKWVEQLSGKTAVAVKMFKTNGAKMAASFSALGSNAEKAGIGMSEQMAVMGQLGATMSGSEAATKYKSFLMNVGRAQDSLGVKMTDSQGKMLSMTEILGNLDKAGFGNLDNVAVADKLKKAFGSDEAVSLIKNLIGNTGELKSNIDKLQKVKGMGPAIKMAKTQVDPLEQLNEGSKALIITIGKVISVGLNPVIKGLTFVLQKVDRAIEVFPALRWVIGIVVGTITAFVAAWSAVQIVLGVIGMIKTLGAAIAVLNVIMAANPIILIILGVVALIAALAGLIYYWDEVCAWVMKYKIYLLMLTGPIGMLAALMILFWDEIVAGAKMCWDNISWVWDAVMNALTGVRDFFGGIVDGMISLALSGIKWILQKVAKLPFIGGKAQAALEVINKYEKGGASKSGESEKSAQTMINKPKTLSVPAGGVQNTYSADNSKEVNISGVTIHAGGGMSPAQLEEWGAMA
jgi:TP901 family phage tail tape measure protein